MGSLNIYLGFSFGEFVPSVRSLPLRWGGTARRRPLGRVPLEVVREKRDRILIGNLIPCAFGYLKRERYRQIVRLTELLTYGVDCD